MVFEAVFAVILFIGLLVFGGLIMLMITDGSELMLATIIGAIMCLIIFIFFLPYYFGVPITISQGQYVGYITSIERNGLIFKGYNIYLKSDLASSNEDVACIDKNNVELINKLKEKQISKENVILEYKGVLQFAIGECPNSDWQIIDIVE